jgi:hypothetical protein
MTFSEPLAGQQDAAEPNARAGAPPADSASSLTTQGWAALEQGEHQQAILYFRRALRLRPGDARARSGVVEALKARHPLYRRVLATFFAISRFSPMSQVGLMLVAFLALRVIIVLARKNAEWAPFLWPPVIVILGLFVLFGLASPLFDVVLKLDPLGRDSLSDDQRRGANLLILNLVLPLPVLFLAIWLGSGLGVVVWILLTMTALPSSAVYRCAPGWPRWAIMAIMFTVLALLAPLLSCAFVQQPDWDKDQQLFWITANVYALIIAQVCATVLLTMRGRT